MGEMDEKVPGQQSQTSQILDALQRQFIAAQEMLGRQQQGQASPMVAPGSAPPAPSPNISFTGGGLPPSSMPFTRPQPSASFTPTGSQGIGGFPTKGIARNAGLTSFGNSLGALISNLEQKDQSKKAALAENYMLQINSLLASGDPKDREKAMAILEDPKIRKALKTGLEYVPLEEEVPPEAIGVKSAEQKIASGQTPGSQQPQRRPILPQPNQMQQQQQQLQSMMTQALIQKIQQDPASAISMMGGSQLSSAEQRAAEFYQKGLGLSPAETAGMTLQEKLTGMKVYEGMMRDAMKMEVDMYKAQVGYQGKVDAAKVLGNARKYWADTVGKYKSTGKDGKTKPDAYHAGAKMYEDMAKKYLDLSKQPNIKPEDKARYEQMANQYSQKAEDYLNQGQDMDLMEDFMQYVEQGNAPE